MLILTYLLIILLLAATNRYAGMDKPFNKEVFGVSIMVALVMLHQPLLVAFASGILAYASRQLISHGIVYQVEKGSRKRGPWFAISFTRATAITALITANASVALFATVLAAFMCLYANIASAWLQKHNYVKDMLVIAEPLQGVSYALAIILCCGSKELVTFVTNLI